MRPRAWATGRRFLAAGLLAMLPVTGCGTDIQPGAAAVVNGQVISQEEVDELVSAACAYSKAARLEQGGAEPSQSMAALRSSLAGALIQFEITDAAADQLGVSVSDAKIAELTAANQMPPGLSNAARAVLNDFFYAASRAQLQQAVVGAHLRDREITTAEAVAPEDIQAAARYLESFASKQEVTVNPSYGSWDGSTLIDVSGSLSDPVSTTPAPADPAAADPVEDLPPSQVCG